jgi:hypothetical protein
VTPGHLVEMADVAEFQPEASPSIVGPLDPTPAPAPAPSPSAELLRQAAEHYERARAAAQRADDWATYGTEMQRLGEILRKAEVERSAERGAAGFYSAPSSHGPQRAKVVPVTLPA